MFFTYIIYSPRLDRYYVGSTNNLQRRLDDLNRGKDEYTRKGSPWDLVILKPSLQKRNPIPVRLKSNEKKAGRMSNSLF